MLKTSHLVKPVYSALQLFYRFGENFKFTFCLTLLTVQYLKTQQSSNGKCPVMCWWGQIFYAVLYKNRETAEPLN